MGVPKRLTEMQKRFAELLVFGGPDGPLSKSEAAEMDHLLCNILVSYTKNDYRNTK
jgi:hypothetical protein